MLSKQGIHICLTGIWLEDVMIGFTFVRFYFIIFSIVFSCLQVLSPLLTADAVELLTNCLTSRETEIWQSLGETWCVPRSLWKYNVPPYQPGNLGIYLLCSILLSFLFSLHTVNISFPKHAAIRCCPKVYIFFLL